MIHGEVDPAAGIVNLHVAGARKLKIIKLKITIVHLISFKFHSSFIQISFDCIQISFDCIQMIWRVTINLYKLCDSRLTTD